MLKKRHLAYWVLFLVIVTLAPQTALADTCDVPVGYPTIQAAVDVFTCTKIFVSAGRFYGDVTIDRTLEITGTGSGSTTLLGKVAVEGSGTSVVLKGLKIEVSLEGLPHNGLVSDGFAETLPDDLVIGWSSALFSDGFESGDLSAWTTTVPE